MESIFDSYKTTKAKAIKGDFIDKLHSQITVTFLFVIFILIGLKQSSDSAILCWYPKFLSGAQGEYVHQFCWINSTYLYLDESNPQKFAESPRTSIPYYQYMMFILFGQLFLFYVPSLLWSVVAADATGYIDKLLDVVDKAKVFSKGVQEAKSVEETKPEVEQSFDESMSRISETDENGVANVQAPSPIGEFRRESSINRSQSLIPNETRSLFSNTFKRILSKDSAVEAGSIELRKTSSMQSKKKVRKLFGKGNLIRKRLINSMKPKHGVKGLTAKYFLLKIFNLFNVIIQLILMTRIFGSEFLFYGLTYFRNIWYTHNPLLLSRQFPYLSLCDYYVHMPSLKVHETTVQCLLAINVLVEKFYILIWFWYMLLIVITFANLLSWFYEIYLPSKSKFLFKYLEIYRKMYGMPSNHQQQNENLNETEKESLIHSASGKTTGSIVPKQDDYDDFESDYLGKDGLVMLLLIKSVAGDISFMELLQILWIDYTELKSRKA